MAKEIFAKGPYARKFALTVREIETLLDVINGQIKGGATTIIGGLPATTETSLRAVMKDLWVWVKDFTILENEVVDLREQVAALKRAEAQITTKAAGTMEVKDFFTESPRAPIHITAADEGVWYDGSRGIYLPAAVIFPAWQNGFKCPEMDALWKVHEAGTLKIELAHPGGEWWEMIAEDENYYDIFVAAEHWYNSHAPEGYYFGTPDWGDDWGLWKVDAEEGQTAEAGE